jgi:aminoglycoside 3-N-acetyltransferase
MPRRWLEGVLPAPLKDWIRGRVQQYKKARARKRPKMSEETFRAVLQERLRLKRGDVVFVHSSTDQLSLAFSAFRLFSILCETVGNEGTLLFPTYPKLPSSEFLACGEVFDVRKSVSYTGLLTELARRHPKAVRSLHPTKSVCAIGPLAEKLTAEHHKSPYPYDATSPYYKVIPRDGKIVGLGLTTSKLSFVYCTDDALKEDFPVMPYLPTLFQAPCIDREGKSVVVETYAHDLTKMIHNVPRYIRKHVPPTECADFTIEGNSFFLAHARPLFERMVELARQGITIYHRGAYKR